MSEEGCDDKIVSQRISKNIIYYSASPAETDRTDSSPQTDRTDSPPQTDCPAETDSPPQTDRTDSPAQTDSLAETDRTDSPPQTDRTDSPPQTDRTDSPPQADRTDSPPQTDCPAETDSPPQTDRTDSPAQTDSLAETDSLVLSSSPLLPPSSHSSRPLLLLFPWLGAKPSGIAKYRDLYLARGVDVLVVESNVWLFLWPRWGLEYGAEILQVLGEPRFTQRPLLVHAFSIGGFTFTQLLVHLAQRPGEFSELALRVRGQVYDSMVVGSLEQMATGLGKTLFPRLECVVRSLALGYFWLLKSHTADIYQKCIQVFYDSPVTSPALFFFCENDRLCNPVAMEDVIDHWRKRGVAVETGRWKESVHAGHLRCHRQQYLSMLETFVNALSLAPLKAKM